MARTASANKIETLTLTTNVPVELANAFKDYCKAQPFKPTPSKVLAFLIEECLKAANVTIPVAPVMATEAATAPANYATLVKAPEKKKAA